MNPRLPDHGWQDGMSLMQLGEPRCPSSWVLSTKLPAVLAIACTEGRAVASQTQCHKTGMQLSPANYYDAQLCLCGLLRYELQGQKRLMWPSSVRD